MRKTREFLGRHWPALVLLVSLAPAVWYLTDHENDVDGEHPAILRPTYSTFPPASYRVAEPGDTLDRMGLYASAAAVVLAVVGWHRARRATPRVEGWPGVLALALIALWQGMNPGPLPDGWHGMGWRAVADSAAPAALRVVLALAGLALGAIALAGRPWRVLRTAPSGACWLFLAVPVLIAASRAALPLPGPSGYWPRWLYFLGVLAGCLGLVRVLPPAGPSAGRLRCRAGVVAAVGSWALLILAGRSMLWFERPIPRLRAVVPGQLYISAMPDRRGLQLATARHHFKTIINLFPEDTHLRSPLLADEEAFVRERGLTYLRNTTFDSDPDKLVDDALALARDPKNWPVLVHCHGCMDRTPAWAGIFEFVERGHSLAAVFQGIERHRGLRPKGSVTLMYARQLPRLAPERFAADPAGAFLLRCAAPALDDYVTRAQPPLSVGTKPTEPPR